MIEPGDKTLVGVSGGVDSVVLLHVLVQLAPVMSFGLHVCYVHHGLRAAADGEADFVAALARHYNLPFTAAHVDVPAAVGAGESRQAVARELRYKALTAAADRGGCRRLAVAHHWDDHLETVLMRFVLGSGPDGLAGIQPVRGRVIRPLLESTRRQIEDYARRHNLAHRFDQSNLDRRYLRNRVRLDLVPYLEEHFNPRVKAAIGRLSRIVADEAAWAEELAAAAATVAVRDRPLYSSLPLTTLAVAALAPVAVPLQRRIIRQALWRAGANRSGFDEAEAVRALITDAADSAPPTGAVDGAPSVAGAAGAVDLPQGVRARRHGPCLYIFPQQWEQPTAYNYVLPVPGTCPVPEAGVHLQAFDRDDIRAHGAPWRVWLPAAPGIANRLTVRNVRPGDRVLTAGAGGTGVPASADKATAPPTTRKLRDLLRAVGVPLPLRPWVPVIGRGPHVLAVIGYYPAAGNEPSPPGGTMLAAWPLATDGVGGAAGWPCGGEGDML